MPERLDVRCYLYLAHAGGPDFARSANIGQQDLGASLKWVHDNISGFGGDPNNVLIFGQSGGGAKVSTLLAMPSAKGLFHSAVIESGPSLTGGTRERANQTAETLIFDTPCRVENDPTREVRQIMEKRGTTLGGIL